MSLSVIHTRANIGIEAPAVTVETHLSNGLPAMTIVGLPETAVRESRERVRSAILNAGLEFPARRITVNLAPADLPKSGGRFDLAIALGILAASGQLPADELEKYEILGELALSGEVRAVEGVIPAILAVRHTGRMLIVPAQNKQEAALVPEVDVCLAGHVQAVCAHFLHGREMTWCRNLEAEPELPCEFEADISAVKGQPHACRALQIAAAGKHNLLFVGPPGTGKTMLANTLASILPGLSNEEMLEVAAVRSVAGESLSSESWRQTPFRSPHHTASSMALVGGGSLAKPGEITLAHRGVLFMDELTQFQRHVLESLREPLEEGVITISRARYRLRYPANFQLIAAMNPCHCGYHGDPDGQCRCTPEKVQRYLDKISGPLLDRIDMSIEVPRVDVLAQQQQPLTAPDSNEVRQRVLACRHRQLQRGGKVNSDLSGEEIVAVSSLQQTDQAMLEAVVKKMKLSTRACYRILRVARTIADYEGCEAIQRQHLAEAISYRAVDRYFSLV